MSVAPTGPMEDVDFPDKLVARVLTPGANPSIHGFRVADDLAPHYSFAEVILLSATGEVPDRDAGRAFEVALVFLAARGVQSASGHAARLARVCAAHEEKVVAVGAVGLAEEARSRVASLHGVLEWLRGATAEFPIAGKDAAAAGAVTSFRAALPESYRGESAFDQSPTLDAAVVTILWRCGVRTTAALITTLTVSALACVSAEAFSEKPAEVRGYPARLPDFSYVEASE